VPAADSAARIPEATIGNETRYVLVTHPDQVLAYRAKLDPVADDRIVFSEPLQGRLSGAEWLFLLPHVRLEDERWSPLPSVLARVEPVDGKPTARLELEVAGARPGSPVELTLRAYLPPPRRAHHRHDPPRRTQGIRCLDPGLCQRRDAVRRAHGRTVLPSGARSPINSA